MNRDDCLDPNFGKIADKREKENNKEIPALGSFSTRKGGIVSCVQRRNVDNILIIIVDDSGVHHPSHLTFVCISLPFQFLVIVIHGSFCFFGVRSFVMVQVLTESGDTVAAEHAEDISLLLGELRRGFSAECSQAFVQELLNASQTQVG